MCRRQRHNSGFVLLMVLMVLTICGVILASTARRCGRLALEAGAATRQIQVRWGALSCRAICLTAPEPLLSKLAASGGCAAGEGEARKAAHSLRLAGMQFHLVLADEQAKANANAILDRQGETGLTTALRMLQADHRQVLPVRLRPAAAQRNSSQAGSLSDLAGAPGASAAPRSVPPAAGRSPEIAHPPGAAMAQAGAITRLPQPYASLEQLLVFQHPAQLTGEANDDPAAVDRITCWGSGKVNLKRAPAEVMRCVLAGLLTETQIAKAEALRRDNAHCTLGEILHGLELKDEQVRALKPFVTDSSTCYSLWVIAEGRNRSWRRLYVQQTGDEENDAQKWTFAW